MIVVVFFFKQKTAYELRISDWSSDVCSSDLALRNNRTLVCGAFPGESGLLPQFSCNPNPGARQAPVRAEHSSGRLARPWGVFDVARSSYLFTSESVSEGHPDRSEEHTSELQSLMRISYAVFCLKKKNK